MATRCPSRRVQRLGWIWLALLLAVLGAAAPVRATSSLSFEGEGYWLELEIGDDASPATAAPTVARVRFHSPGDAKGVLLPAAAVTVERFDSGRRVLLLRHLPPRSGDNAPAFTLRVHKQRAQLEIEGRRIVADFDWSM